MALIHRPSAITAPMPPPALNLHHHPPPGALPCAASAREVVTHLPPHIYLVAAHAFRAMVREKTSQSLVINGESGAGKTETTKKAMQYFASLAGGTGGGGCRAERLHACTEGTAWGVSVLRGWCSRCSEAQAWRRVAGQ
jgi:hypothetical protein